MQGVRVMVVDDDELILGLMKRFFSRRGDDCTVVSNGADAVNLVQDRFFDLVLTDIMMPGMDGLELVRRIRVLQPHTVCILMSGRGSRLDMIAALKAGVFDFLDKPFADLTELGMIVDRAAESSRLMQERDALLENLKQQNSRLEFSLLRLHEAFGQLREQEEALESDLINAQRVQRKFLPDGFPRQEGLELFGYYAPCEHLGGDFFGVIPVEGGKLGIYMVDVTGHGVSAAMITVTLRELMRTSARYTQKGDLFASPVDVLTFINDSLLAEAFVPPIYVSMVYAVFDPLSGKVNIASAGHPPPLLVTDRVTNTPVPVSGPVLGVKHAEPFHSTEVSLNPGDVMLFFSDGLPDARGGNGDEITVARVGDMLAHFHGQSAFAVGDGIEQALAAHLNGESPADDITFIVACRPVATAATWAASRAGDEPVGRNSVKVVMPTRVRRFSREMRGRLKGGWHEHSCIIRVNGVATWQLAPTFREMLKKAKSEGADSIHVDLAECEGMDSTMLGLLLQHAEEIKIHQPGRRVVGQFREMGVFEFLTVVHEPCATPEAPLAVEAAESRRACSDLILSAHEALMEASTENRERFKDVVSALRNSQVTPSP